MIFTLPVCPAQQLSYAWSHVHVSMGAIVVTR